MNGHDKRKADPTESLACARFAIVEQPPATQHNPPEFQPLRDTVALLEAAAKQQTRLVNQLHGLLARVFPELAVHVSDLSANWVLTLLEKGVVGLFDDTKRLLPGVGRFCRG